MPLLPAPPSQSPAPAGEYVGEAACVSARDAACETPRRVIGTLPGRPAWRLDVDPRNHPAPRKPVFYRPDRTRLLISLKGS